MPHRSRVRVATPALDSGATEEPCVARSLNSHSSSGYARSCGSASPRFAPSPGSQQSSYGSGLGAGLGSYGAPGVTGLGVPGSPSFLNGSTATSPFASECPQPTGSAHAGVGVSPGNAEWTQPCLQPILGCGLKFLPYACGLWPSHGESLVLFSYGHSLVLDRSITGSPGILRPNFLHLKPYLLTPVVHIVSSPSMIVKLPLIRGTCAETWWTATFWAFTGTSGGGWRPLLEA